MMLDKNLYESLEHMLNADDKDALERMLYSCQDEGLHDMTRLFMNGSKKELDTELKMFKRFQKLLSNYIEDFMSYNIGILVGIYRAIGFMTKIIVNNNDFEKEMEALYQKANVKEILRYLQEHPNAQHKVIAQDLKLKPNRLSQIMKELEMGKCVLRYGVDRRCFYELSLDGQAFLKKKIDDNGSLKYTEKLLDTMGLLDKRRIQTIGRGDSHNDTVKIREGEVLESLHCFRYKSDYQRTRSKRSVPIMELMRYAMEADKIG